MTSAHSTKKSQVSTWMNYQNNSLNFHQVQFSNFTILLYVLFYNDLKANVQKLSHCFKNMLLSLHDTVLAEYTCPMSLVQPRILLIYPTTIFPQFLLLDEIKSDHVNERHFENEYKGCLIWFSSGKIMCAMQRMLTPLRCCAGLWLGVRICWQSSLIREAMNIGINLKKKQIYW